MSVKLYGIQYQIGEATYCAHLPATSWKHAEELASKIGATVYGEDLHEIPVIPVEQLMEFLGQCADDNIRWKHNAREQIEAFLAIGWPKNPNQLPD